MRILQAEVVENKIAYNEFIDPETDITYPKGVIRVTLMQTRTGMPALFYCIPLFPTDQNIPLVGEHVLIFQLPSYQSHEFYQSQAFYYLNNTVAIRERLLDNIFVGLHARTSGDEPNLELGVTTEVSEEVAEKEDTPKIQPYEGDHILQSRYGSIIRFGSNNYKDKEKDYEQKQPPWDGADRFSPIVTITNGLAKGNTYTIEDPKKDKSFIYLTSDQKIKIDTSQNKLGLGTISAKNYDKSQIILSADRLLFNSREDYLILSGKKSVNIATPNWQMDMNKFFDLFDSFLDEVIKTARGESNYLTGVGPTGGNPTLLVGAQRIKTELFRMRQ